MVTDTKYDEAITTPEDYWTYDKERGDEWNDDRHGWVSVRFGDYRHLTPNENMVLGIVTHGQCFENKFDKFKKDKRYTKGINALAYDAGIPWSATKETVLSLEVKGYFDVEQHDHAAWIIDVIHAPSYGIYNPNFAYPVRPPREKASESPPLLTSTEQSCRGSHPVVCVPEPPSPVTPVDDTSVYLTTATLTGIRATQGTAYSNPKKQLL